MHDAPYKKLFSHPPMIQDLLTGFVEQDWTHALDFASLERCNGSYVTDDLRERHGDMVWRARLGGEFVYLYLLLEFQSSVDPFMAVRILTYVGLLHQDLIRSQAVSGQSGLPPVFPLVLYNGDRSWSAATSVRELVQPLPEALLAYQPQQCYWLIDEGRYEAEMLNRKPNRVAALIQIENSQQPAELERALDCLVAWLRGPEQASLRQAFTEWLTQRILPTRFPGQSFDQLHDLMEVQAMVHRRVPEWTREWEENGRQKGLQEGIQQGMQEGIQKGIQEGIQEGMQKAVHEVARQLLANGVSRTVIAVCTGLSEDDLDKMLH